MVRLGYVILVVLAIAIIAIAFVTVILLNSISSDSLRVEVSSRIVHLNVTAVVLGSKNFVNVFMDRFGGMVSRVIVFEDFSPEMMQYADRSTILIVGLTTIVLVQGIPMVEQLLL